MFPTTIDTVSLGDGWTAQLKREINGADMERFWQKDAGDNKYLILELHLVGVTGPDGITQAATPEMIRQMPLSWVVVLMQEAAERTLPLARMADRTGRLTTSSEDSQTKLPGV